MNRSYRYWKSRCTCIASKLVLFERYCTLDSETSTLSRSCAIQMECAACTSCLSPSLAHRSTRPQSRTWQSSHPSSQPCEVTLRVERWPVRASRGRAPHASACDLFSIVYFSKCFCSYLVQVHLLFQPFSVSARIGSKTNDFHPKTVDFIVLRHSF